MKKRRVVTIFLYLLVLVLLFSFVLRLFRARNDGLPYSQIVDLFQQEQVRSFLVEDGRITMKLWKPYNGNTKVVTALADPWAFRQEL